MLPGNFSKTIKTLGGDDNAFTSQDFTAYHESVAVQHLQKVMEMEADRMLNLSVPAEHYASEKQVIIEERRQRTENDPRALFGEQMQSTLFVNHPYGKPVIGWMKEMSSYEWPDVKAFYDKWYAPNNAILVVSGDITAAQLKPLAEKIYGVLPTKALPTRVRPEVPPAIAPIVMTLHHETINQPMYQRMYIAPGCRQNKKDCLALQVLEEVLDGGSTTRLYQSLVVEQKKATSVQFSYSGDALDYGTLSLGAVPAENVTPVEIGNLIEAQIASVIEKGVTDVEVSEAAQRLKDEAVYARDSVMGPAMIFGYALATGSSIADVENWPNDIANVTAADVQRVAKEYLSVDKPWIRPAVTGYLLPEEKPTAPAPVGVPAPVTEGQQP
jgi:zinc protease